MKIVFLNDAIVSYVEFLQRVLVSNEKKEENNSAKEFTDFIDCYKQLRENDEIIWHVNDITRYLNRFPIGRIKIYYTDINKLLVFVQLLLEKNCLNNDLHFLTSLSDEDLEKIQSALHDFWCKDKDSSIWQYIYLDKDDVSNEVIRNNMLKQLDETKEIFQEINNIQTKTEKEA